MVYIISFDLSRDTEETYEDVEETIKALAQGSVQVLDSVWFIKSNLQPHDIFMQLGTTKVANKLVIVQVTKTGWLSCGKERISDAVNQLFN